MLDGSEYILCVHYHLKLQILSFPLPAPSRPPSNLAVTDFGEDYIAYAWNQPPCGHRNGAIQQYHYSITSGKEGSTTALSETVRNLYPGTSHNFTVSAVTSMGEGPKDFILQATSGKLRVRAVFIRMLGCAMFSATLNLVTTVRLS